MLFKKSVFFLLLCALLYFVVTVETTTSQWTDQQLLLNKPFLENDESHYNDHNNTTIVCYFSSWMTKSWDLTRKMWHQWWRRYSDKINAQTCIEQLIILTNIQGKPNRMVVNNQYYCRSYFGDQELARTTLRDAKNYIDEWGEPKTGYVAYAPIEGNRDERFGVAVHCHGGEAWVNHQLAGKHEPNVKYPSNDKSWYGSIVSMII